MRTARPGPGNGWRWTISFGRSELQAGLAHFVLEELAERFDQLEVHVLRQAADVVMALDERGGIAGDRDALDHVGIKRALGEELNCCIADFRFLILRSESLSRVLETRG